MSGYQGLRPIVRERWRTRKNVKELKNSLKVTKNTDNKNPKNRKVENVRRILLRRILNGPKTRNTK